MKSAFSFKKLINSVRYISFFEKVFEGTPNRLALPITPAFGLFVTTKVTVARPLSWKYSMMFSALVPEPEAKIMILR